MRHYLRSIIALAVVLASGWTANQLSAGPVQREDENLQDRHARYYAEIRAQVALGPVVGECGAQ
jgi:hypothetical protein